jgi:hypothetical protein
MVRRGGKGGKRRWRISNDSMTTALNGARPAHMAWRHMEGKPCTVSEYNHCLPNQYASELFPMLTSFGAFQDWDGFYHFNFQTRFRAPHNRYVNGHHEMVEHPGHLAVMPIATLMFRMEAVEAGADPLYFEVPKEALFEFQATQRIQFKLPIPKQEISLLRPIRWRFTDAVTKATFPSIPVPDRRVSSTGQIVWDVTDAKRPVYTVNAPAVRLAIGYIGGREIRLGDATIRVMKALDNWALVAIGALDGKPLRESRRVLVSVVGRVENTDMGWNEDRTSVGNDWGGPPVVAEAVEATITLPLKGTVSALDATGAPKGKVAFRETADGLAFETAEKYETLMYGVAP